MRTDLAAASLVASLAAAGAPALGAQEEKPTRPVIFLERAHFALGTPSGKDLIFEGQPTVHYFFWNRLADETWQREGGWKVALPVSALLQVRMSDATSEPVRTPSYRIRPLYAQFIHLKRPADERLAYRLVGISTGAAHYSNGQAGCTFRGYSRGADETCVVTDASLAAQRLANTLDGDFSTSYVSLGVHFRRGKLFGSDDPMKWQYTLSVEGQVHPLGMRPGGINRELAEAWGHHQWSAAAEGERRVTADAVPTWLGWIGAGVLRAGVAHERRLWGGVPASLGRTSVELAFISDRVEHFGVFLRHDTGFDYYNINFQDHRGFHSFGVTWDVGRLDRLNTAPPE